MTEFLFKRGFVTPRADRGGEGKAMLTPRKKGRGKNCVQQGRREYQISERRLELQGEVSPIKRSTIVNQKQSSIRRRKAFFRGGPKGFLFPRNKGKIKGRGEEVHQMVLRAAFLHPKVILLERDVSGGDARVNRRGGSEKSRSASSDL